jgi:energy-converting hydrogenase B subunit D
VAEPWLDVVLAAALLWAAWRAVAGRGIFSCVVFYIAFGLLLSLTWVRLDAPDIALAEAAIGAGITGALLLDAVTALRRPRSGRSGRAPGPAADGG